MVRKAKVEFDERPPDDFDPKNPYGDPVAMLEYREHLVREKWIQIETAKIIRDRLRWCYRIEGVNHHQKCRHLVDQYLESTRGVGWGKDHRPADLHGTVPSESSSLVPPVLFASLVDMVSWLFGGVQSPRRWSRPRSSTAASADVPGMERSGCFLFCLQCQIIQYVHYAAYN